MKKKFYFLLALMLGCVGLMCAQAYAAPQVGKIYYMKGKRSQKYLKASGTSLTLSAEKTTDCLFYVDTDNKIKAYLTSNYINCSGKNLSATTSDAGVFTAGTDGAYYYKNNGYYIYGGANTSATNIDRGTSYGNDAGYQWYFEEYTPPTVNQTIVDGQTYFIRSVTRNGHIYAYAGTGTTLGRSTENQGTDAYRWTATKVSDGVYSFQNVGDNAKYFGFKATTASAKSLTIAASEKRAECFTIWSSSDSRFLVGNVNVGTAWNQAQTQYNTTEVWSTDFQFVNVSDYVLVTYNYKEGETLVGTKTQLLKKGDKYQAPYLQGYLLTSVVSGTTGNADYETYEVPVTSALADVRAVIGDGTIGGGGCGIYWIGLDIPATDVNGNTVEEVPLYNIHLMSQTGNGYNQSYMVVSNSSNLSAGSVVAVSQNNPAAASSSAAYLCYNFNKEKLAPGRYYLFFVADKNAPTVKQTYRTVLCSATKNYAPQLCNSNNAIKTNWHPNIKVNVANIQQAMSTVYGEKWVTIDFVRDAGYSWKISGTAAGATPSNLANDSEIGTNRQWCFVGTPESFKIYSRAAGEALALTTNTASIADGTQVSLTAAESACRWQAFASGAGYEITRVGEKTMTLNSHGGKGQQIKYYNKGDNGAVWTINLLKTLTVKQSVPGVEGTYSWNGQTKTGSTVTFQSTSYVNNAPLTCSTVPGYDVSLPATTWNGASDKQVTVTLTPTFFTTQADYDANNNNVHWVRITNANETNFSPEAVTPGEVPSVNTIDLANEAQLWCFVGDKTNGFKIYNKAHPGYVLQADNANPGDGANTTLVQASSANASQSTWVLGENYLSEANKPGYTILIKGKTSFGLNKYKGKLRFWNATGAGSHWTIYEVGGELTINVNVTGNVLPINSKVGAISVSYNGQTTTTRLNLGELTAAGQLTQLKVRTPKGTAITIADGNPKFAGYDFAGIDYDGQTNQQSITINNVPVDGTTATVNYTATAYQNLFYTKDAEHPYRIPAIVKTKDGTLIAASDYRYCGGDVGNGRVDIVVRRSSDNGATWSDQITVAQGWRNATEKPAGNDAITETPYGFGDATLVADDQSGAVLLGYVGAPSNATCWTDRPDYFFQQSLDNGQTWGEKFSVMSQIKAKANATGNYTMKNFFVGSGKIVMSRKYKKQGAQYKRIYCVLWGYGQHGTEDLTRTNWVVYSDDFGKTWDILGGTYAAKGSCDEPKCEELPDGNIVLSSRESGCRWFNTFTYSDKENGTGTWGTAIKSNSVSEGLSFGGNATNGEIQVLRVLAQEGTEVHNIVLQSIPTAGSRSNVSIYYKNLDDPSSYSTPEAFSKGWTLGKVVAPYGSAYSTMCVQADGKIAFFYEDGKSGAGYDMVYVPLTIAELTNNTYSEIVLPVQETEGSTNEAIKLEGDVVSTTDVTEMITSETTSIDLSEANIKGRVTAAQIQQQVATATDNDNALIIVSETTDDEGATNVIKKNNEAGTAYTCQNLHLTDNGTFTSPVSFTAATANYNRTVAANANDFGTICLPFSAVSDENIQFYQLTSSTGNAFVFTPIDEAEANTPVLYKRLNKENVTVNRTSVAVVPVQGEMAAAGTNYKMVGVFQPTSVVDAETTAAIEGFAKVVDPNCYYIKQGQFFSLNQRMNLKPFRAYITPTNEGTMQVPLMNINIEDNVHTDIQIIEGADKTVTIVYDLAGRRLQKPEKGLNIVNGQKIILKK